MNKEILLENPYGFIKVDNIMVHYGNGAKDALKKENKQFNFKFYYNIGTKIKFCSAGFNKLCNFKELIKPFKEKYYMFEYIMENKKCIPYFDYEYETDNQPSDKELSKLLINILSLIEDVFDEVFSIKFDKKLFKISSSHGFKKNKLFKVSFHICIIGYYFDNNYDCKYVCDILNKKDSNFDISVYSKDRMMRMVLSYKDWNDNRQLVGITWKHMDIDINIDTNSFDDYLVTNVKNTYVKLVVPVIVKTKVLKNIYSSTNKQIKIQNEMGGKLEQIIQKYFHNDAYFEKSIIKIDKIGTKLFIPENLENDEAYINGITFYGFNYNDRNKKCFTGNKHDRVGFYCYVDNANNIVVKCFSAHCKDSKYIIGNLNDSICFRNTFDLSEKYITNSPETMNIMNKLKKNMKSFILKSAMGTAKTDILIKYIKANEINRILVISTRQSYANNIYKRFDNMGFVNYLDDKLNFHTKDKIIVQMESLHHLTKEPLKPFDLVVLDEIESILYQFSSETILMNSESTFDLLCKICEQKQTKLVALDADYNIRAHEFMKSFGTYEMVQNFYKNDVIKIELTNNLDFFIDDIKKAIKKKQKICIIGLSTKMLYQIAEKLDELGVKYILHTRDSDDILKKKLTDVNELWSEYQVVMFSPTISVGVDHTLKYFDKVYSIIISDCASPRIYLQMLGRIRNMKSNNILTYYQNMNICINKILYDIDDAREYFKYVDNDFKAIKKHDVDENGNLYTYLDEGLYNKIMMHNKIENLNKSSELFMTCLNTLCNESNYKLVFLENKNEYQSAGLDDDVYKKKIVDAEDINESKFLEIAKNINNNCATENEKFSFQKYRFKKFWNLNEVDGQDMKKYFRKEKTINNLRVLFDKEVIDDNYIDYNVSEKINVIEMMIKTLGFDKNDLMIKLPRNEYYENVKILLSNSEFSKDYDKIRTMFERPKTKLNANLKGPSLAKFVNGYFEEFGMYISTVKTSNIINGKKKDILFMTLNVPTKFIPFLENKKKGYI